MAVGVVVVALANNAGHICDKLKLLVEVTWND